MVKFTFEPEYDKDYIPKVDMSWEADIDVDIHEITRKFRRFLKAMTFTDSTAERVQVLSDEELKWLRDFRAGKHAKATVNRWAPTSDE